MTKPIKPKQKNGCANCALLVKGKHGFYFCSWPVPFWFVTRLAKYDYDMQCMSFGAVGRDDGENCATWVRKKRKKKA